MDILFQYLLLLALLPLSFASLFLLHKNAFQGPSLNRPPGTTGWPVVGENINQALEGAQNFITNRMKRYSPLVFKTRLMGEEMAIFCGQQGNKFLFTQESEILATWIPISFKRIMIIPEHYEEHRETSSKARKLATDIFKPEALNRCIPVMHSLARKHIDSDWGPNQQVKVFPLSKKYNFRVSCNLFLGIEDPDAIDMLSDPFVLLRSGLYSFPVNIPGTVYGRALKAGMKFRAMLLRIVRERREEIKESKETERRDVLSEMLLQNYCEKDIIHNIIALLVGSYDSTSIAMTFALKILAELPHIYDKVFQELTAIARTKGSELLTWDDIRKIKYTWNVVRESMRVAPPSQGFFREAATDFTFAGFTIPKGWKAFWNVYSTHNDPVFFPEPEKIDPARFEGSGPKPYTYVPFGAGSRVCPGREYARIVILVYVYNVVTRFKLEKAAPNEKITYDPIPTPMEGLPLRLHPHAA